MTRFSKDNFVKFFFGESFICNDLFELFAIINFDVLVLSKSQSINYSLNKRLIFF